MKFRDKRSGVVYEPSCEQVARWMAQNPNLEEVEDKKPAPRKTVKSKTE